MVTQARRTKSVQRILDAAAELFYTHGLRGVGVDEVVAASGVSKSTLYVHFRSKDDLVAAYLTATDESWIGQLQAAAERAGVAPVEQLVGLFDALLDAFDRHGFFGCPFVSAAVESPIGSQARAITLAHTARRQAWITGLCERSGASEPARLASHLGLLIDGAMTRGRLEQDRSVVQDAKEAARAAIQSSSVPVAPR
ncbi:TetR/AcrR family transcriptional regulator [Micromonospora cremea]|uniref:DNA-binding transcriptional regulator, AcrR family n=1 Tax=Micromonospora cremea TaxID=709881 RepID=A0A1N6B3H9_9ACTN|nr:TetR/AcrR family transcriptional regulator [Micromonospora cremea]SIN40959.1 DNA-binding transcriptional regulator, AcrR family [Micromonospora cremea]